MGWFEQFCMTHPADDGWKVFVFTHAPPNGSGLRVLQENPLGHGRHRASQTALGEVAGGKGVDDVLPAQFRQSGRALLSLLLGVPRRRHQHSKGTPAGPATRSRSAPS